MTQVMSRHIVLAQGGSVLSFFKPDPAVHKLATKVDYRLSQTGTPP
jgi:hypothetical protein